MILKSTHAEKWSLNTNEANYENPFIKLSAWQWNASEMKQIPKLVIRNKPEGRSNRSPDGPGFKTGFTLGCWKCKVKLNQQEQ
jgi:hypothetical protein